jgi:membrane associated rhomboid family serine protease
MCVSSQSITNPLKIWQLLSYGFAHADLLHLALNMLTLWFFGREMEDQYGKREFLAFYLASMLFGGLCFAVEQVVLQRYGFTQRNALGASGACAATLLLFILNHPQRTLIFFVPMPAWILGIVVVAMNLLGIGARQTAFDIHLFGLFFAAVYFWLGIRLTRRMPSGSWLGNLRRRWRVSRSKLKVHASNWDDADVDLETEGDRVLAKLNASGDASLTDRERRVLEEYSRRTREKLRRRSGRE